MSIQNDMSIDEAIEVIDTEMKCVERQSFPGQCNRDCFNCDLVLLDHTILCAYDMAKYALRYMKDTTEKDEILTLEELREMDGQPIWVCDAISPFWKGWAVLDADKAYLPGIAYRWYDLKDYRKKWFAYRQKKEPSHD